MNQKVVLESSMNALADCFKVFDWRERTLYACFLSQSYYFVCHSVPLLCAAAARMGEDKLWARDRFIKHMNEEHNHQLLALRDVKNLGFETQDFGEMAATRMLYESIYYKIDYQSPLAIMGYILFLEAAAAQFGPDIMKTLNETYERRCVSFMKVHAEEDEDHVEKAQQLISELSPKEQQWVLDTFEQTAEAYIHLIKSIISFSKNSKLRVAA